MTLQGALERYIRQEGLYEFTPSPSSDWEKILTGRILLLWVLTVSLLSALISILYGKGWFLGLLTPIAAISITFVAIAMYSAFVTLIKKQIVASPKSSTLGTYMLISFLSLGGLWMWVYTSRFLGALSFVVGCAGTLLLYALFTNVNNYHYFAQRVVQTFRRIVFTTSNAISVIPLALITLLLSLVSGNLLSTVASLELTRVVIVIGVILGLFYVATTNPRKISKELTISTPKELIERVFRVDMIADGFVSKQLSMEDKDDAAAALEWRDVLRSLKLTENQLEKHIKAWYSGTVVLSSLVLGLGYAIVFFLIIVIMNPDLVKVDSTINIVIADFHEFVPSLKTSVFLALIQIFAFWSSLLDRSRESEFIRNVWEKVVDWIVVITLHRALYCVNAEFWSVKLNTPFPKAKKLEVPEYKVIVRDSANKSRIHMTHICHKMKELNPTRKAIRFEIYYANKRKEVEVETAFPDWVYFQPLGNVAPILNELSHADVQEWEHHLLGRKKFITGEATPDSWFGEGDKAVRLGRDIWNSDTVHKRIMHPKITVSDIGVFVQVRLFRRLERSEEYKKLCITCLKLAHQHFPGKDTIDIWVFYRMDDTEKIAELSWFNTLPNKYSYRDEYSKRSRVYQLRLN